MVLFKQEGIKNTGSAFKCGRYIITIRLPKMVGYPSKCYKNSLRLFWSVEVLDEMLAMRPSSDSSSTEANVVSKDQNYAYRLLKMYNLCEGTSVDKDL